MEIPKFLWLLDMKSEERKAYNKEWSRKYYLNNKDKVDTRNKRWKTENAEYYRKKLLWSRYKITPEDYDALVIGQRGECRICKVHQDTLKLNLHVDHDHTTGKVRGLLCENCNRGLGMFKDSAEILAKAIDYLNDNH